MTKFAFVTLSFYSVLKIHSMVEVSYLNVKWSSEIIAFKSLKNMRDLRGLNSRQ